jgi:hypothetical protein
MQQRRELRLAPRPPVTVVTVSVLLVIILGANAVTAASPLDGLTVVSLTPDTIDELNFNENLYGCTVVLRNASYVSFHTKFWQNNITFLINLTDMRDVALANRSSADQPCRIGFKLSDSVLANGFTLVVTGTNADSLCSVDVDIVTVFITDAALVFLNMEVNSRPSKGQYARFALRGLQGSVNDALQFFATTGSVYTLLRSTGPSTYLPPPYRSVAPLMIMGTFRLTGAESHFVIRDESYFSCDAGTTSTSAICGGIVFGYGETITIEDQAVFLLTDTLLNATTSAKFFEAGGLFVYESALMVRTGGAFIMRSLLIKAAATNLFPASKAVAAYGIAITAGLFNNPRRIEILSNGIVAFDSLSISVTLLSAGHGVGIGTYASYAPFVMDNGQFIVSNCSVVGLTVASDNFVAFATRFENGQRIIRNGAIFAVLSSAFVVTASGAYAIGIVESWKGQGIFVLDSSSTFIIANTSVIINGDVGPIHGIVFEGVASVVNITRRSALSIQDCVITTSHGTFSTLVTNELSGIMMQLKDTTQTLIDDFSTVTLERLTITTTSDTGLPLSYATTLLLIMQNFSALQITGGSSMVFRQLTLTSRTRHQDTVTAGIVWLYAFGSVITLSNGSTLALETSYLNVSAKLIVSLVVINASSGTLIVEDGSSLSFSRLATYAQLSIPSGLIGGIGFGGGTVTSRGSPPGTIVLDTLTMDISPVNVAINRGVIQFAFDATQPQFIGGNDTVPFVYLHCIQYAGVVLDTSSPFLVSALAFNSSTVVPIGGMMQSVCYTVTANVVRETLPRAIGYEISAQCTNETMLPFQCGLGALERSLGGTLSTTFANSTGLCSCNCALNSVIDSPRAVVNSSECVMSPANVIDNAASGRRIASIVAGTTKGTITIPLPSPTPTQNMTRSTSFSPSASLSPTSSRNAENTLSSSLTQSASVTWGARSHTATIPTGTLSVTTTILRGATRTSTASVSPATSSPSTDFTASLTVARLPTPSMTPSATSTASVSPQTFSPSADFTASRTGAPTFTSSATSTWSRKQMHNDTNSLTSSKTAALSTSENISMTKAKHSTDSISHTVSSTMSISRATPPPKPTPAPTNITTHAPQTRRPPPRPRTKNKTATIVKNTAATTTTAAPTHAKKPPAVVEAT